MTKTTKTMPWDKAEARAEAFGSKAKALSASLRAQQANREATAEGIDLTDPVSAQEGAMKLLALDKAIDMTSKALRGAQDAASKVKTWPHKRLLTAETVAWVLDGKVLEAAAVAGHEAPSGAVDKPLVTVVQTAPHEVAYGNSGGISGAVEIYAQTPAWMGDGHQQETGRAIIKALRDGGVNLGQTEEQALIAYRDEAGLGVLRLGKVFAVPEVPIVGIVSVGEAETTNVHNLGLGDRLGSIRVEKVERDGDTQTARAIVSYSEPAAGNVTNQHRSVAESMGRRLVGKVLPGVGRVTEFDRVEVRSAPTERGQYHGYRYFVTAVGSIK